MCQMSLETYRKQIARNMTRDLQRQTYMVHASVTVLLYHITDGDTYTHMIIVLCNTATDSTSVGWLE